jgi:hypothetical protein
VDFLAFRPNYAASLNKIVDFHFLTATPAPSEGIDLPQQYSKNVARRNKPKFIRYLIEHASRLEGCRRDVNFNPPEPNVYDWHPLIRALHAKYDPKFPGGDSTRRSAARAHWNSFLAMADVFDIGRYDDGSVQPSESELAGLQRELELFGESHYGLDDLLGVLVPRIAWS